MSRMGDKMIDELNKDGFVVLQPGEVWTPGMSTEIKIDDNNCSIHIWQKVTLLTTTVTECKKCGKLKEQE